MIARFECLDIKPSRLAYTPSFKDKREIFQKEAIHFLSRPGRVLAQKEDLVGVAMNKEIVLHTNSSISIEVKVDPDFIEIIESSGAELLLHLKSNLAQAGLTIENFRPSKAEKRRKGDYRVRLKNVGPNEIIIPKYRALPIGNPYGYRKAEPMKIDTKQELEKIKSANKNSSGKHNKFEYIEETDEIGIQVERVLVYPKGGKKVTLDEKFPRGTQRGELHKVLGLKEIEPKKAETFKQMCARYEINQHTEDYVLIQTNDPIHYPEGQGVLMTGGLIQHDGHDELFMHGPSNLGQHRKHEPWSHDPEHPLIGEFHFSPLQILEYIYKNRFKVFLTATPVNLRWVNKDGFFEE
ncbi:MAG: hypothetical protein UR89_C0018G0008 [Candidatus Roizmanbacteria bacterium GW2011_GWA2_35_8]|uniref:Uncharacterized protein n=1 Tax=Candidatus Roizmanbacteria bacterium GW2011_GWA2_35_8 TaxID=1618479 RepID=A0A0G0CZZ9_9BACT|nr:MAG: hypothetical protein UR89_C0018G0008 [Candidatus Roizmanbacteria bacterium GW2011_GWA2_35_8]